MVKVHSAIGPRMMAYREMQVEQEITIEGNTLEDILEQFKCAICLEIFD
jgi:hypothetical protein